MWGHTLEIIYMKSIWCVETAQTHQQWLPVENQGACCKLGASFISNRLPHQPTSRLANHLMADTKCCKDQRPDYSKPVWKIKSSFEGAPEKATTLVFKFILPRDQLHLQQAHFRCDLCNDANGAESIQISMNNYLNSALLLRNLQLGSRLFPPTALMIFGPQRSSERIIIQPDAMGKWDKNAADVDSRPSELTAASSHICWALLHQTGHMGRTCGDIITAVDVCREAIQLRKNAKAKHLWYSQSKRDERKKKREDERLVFSKPRWFVMLEV